MHDGLMDRVIVRRTQKMRHIDDDAHAYYTPSGTHFRLASVTLFIMEKQALNYDQERLLCA